jgi:hypothetical protein
MMLQAFTTNKLSHQKSFNILRGRYNKACLPHDSLIGGEMIKILYENISPVVIGMIQTLILRISVNSSTTVLPEANVINIPW